jgi:CheY-like chemotaxis protein
MQQMILLVEDNDDDVFLVQRALAKAGVTESLRVAADGREALDFLQTALRQDESSNVPCLILLDLKMPRVPGLEVLDWIRKQPRLRALPVIVLTSSSADADVEAAYRLGANSYFSKPATSEDLLSLMKLLHEYWFKRCVLPPRGKG